jgi:N-acyl-phosphatidylethanolamine-hydrolysing phospholipase D
LPNKKNIHVFVPLGLKNFFLKRGYTHIHELDWQMKHCEFDITFTAFPSVHYSGRSLSDKNKTLWCSWVIKSASGLYYFVGDTAYSPHIFKQIGKQFGPFDLAMVTIGTYGNRKYDVNNHTTPEEALHIGLDTKAKNILGMHWGTIEMSEEPPFEPLKRFKQEADHLNISQNSLWIMKIGESRSLPGLY